VVRFWQSRIDRKFTQLVKNTREEVLRAIGAAIEHQFANIDKATYVTLDYRMDGDSPKCLRIPLSMNRVTECLQGMRLQLVDHSRLETVYSVSTLGHHAPIRLHWHYHNESETVQVIRGRVTDVQTGRIYMPGEIWAIEGGSRHAADFDGYALCTVRPPLPWASSHPIDLDDISRVYDSPEPPQAP
jgi:hypothetical protein